MRYQSIRLPRQGIDQEAVLTAMRAAQAHDIQWRRGKAFSLVFKADDLVTGLLTDAYNMFLVENGLNPTAFPSLRRFETEVIAMTAHLLGGDSAVAGNMTTGGTESILMAVLTAREWARANHPSIAKPVILLPDSAHPAFDKAAHYLGVEARRVPVRADLRADVEAMAQALTSDTILLVGSAPSYPHGVVDPIADIAALALNSEILCHVDACVGGMMLPFVRKLRYPSPDFDFQVPGVTSLSVDLHKYGYAAKGASVILYRNRQLRRHQLFATTDWPGGIYASPTMTGTRPGGAIAAAWAVMMYLGEAGYLSIADQVMRTTIRLRDGINATAGLRVPGDPEMSVLSVVADNMNIYEIGDEMTQQGWHLDRQQFPPSLHLTVSYGHIAVVEAFLHDLRQAVLRVQQPSIRKVGNAIAVKAAQSAAKALPESWVSQLTTHSSRLFSASNGLPQRSAAMYGMMGTLPNRGDLHELVLDLVEGFTELGQ